jgi:[acyl-carrier-protein] S-malonyltransferase
MHLRR